jgi:hypothetical protein
LHLAEFALEPLQRSEQRVGGSGDLAVVAFVEDGLERRAYRVPGGR